MLEGLDDIPWQQLHHGYGTAEDVPELLRALAGGGEQQEEALYALFGNIWHQGTVYEASSYAVPFLAELATASSVARRGEILGLIGTLADGKSYLAVHARTDRKTGEFEKELANELEHVHRTREAVFNITQIIGRLLRDPEPTVRAGAAYVFSRFPEHVLLFAPIIRQAAKTEDDQLALAGMLWCLGCIGDASQATITILGQFARAQTADPRPALAAAIALYRITGGPDIAAIPLCRQLAAAPWFAESFLAGVPWDFSGEVHLESMLSDIEPDALGATQTLLKMLDLPPSIDGHRSIVHDLLSLNFADGKWRDVPRVTKLQNDVLSHLVDNDSVWKDPKGLWFLVPDGAKRVSQLVPSDIANVREEMRSVIRREN